jgi:serine protease Do
MIGSRWQPMTAAGTWSGATSVMTTEWKRRGSTMIVAAVAAVVGTALPVAGAAQTPVKSSPRAASPGATAAPGTADAAIAVSTAIESTARVAGAAVVEIFTMSYTPTEGRVAGTTDLVRTQRSSGSGAIVDPSGYIVTNAHVVRGAQRIRVEVPTVPSGGSILAARGRMLDGRIVGLDLETDLALVKVEAAGLPTLAFGDSDDLRAGQLVVALGSPLGFHNSVSLGVVSAVARQLEPESPMVYVQSDAAISSGSSGGPLVDLQGRIVGINTLVASREGAAGDGPAFAAPSNIVKGVYEQLRQHGRVRRGDIGVRPQTLTPVLAAGLGLKREYGVVLADVLPGGPAAQAGLRPGDVVLALDGKAMENGRQLQVGLYRRSIGDVVALDIQRDGEPRSLRVTLTGRRDSLTALSAGADPRDHVVARLGILGVDLTATVARVLPPLRIVAGVLIVSTTPGILDTRDGELRAGDVIHVVNRQPVAGMADLRAALAAVKPGDPVVMHVERGGELLFVTFVAD